MFCSSVNLLRFMFVSFVGEQNILKNVDISGEQVSCNQAMDLRDVARKLTTPYAHKF
jgi:hypothetical protein